MKLRPLVLLTGLLAAGAAHAQSSVTIYGILDEYVGYIRSGTGTHVTSINDGGLLKSRFGFKGIEDLGGGYKTTFQLESGFNGNNGASTQSNRIFDRQAWVGMQTPAGEFRVGRQATAIFFTGLMNDYTGRTTYGSVMNDIGNPTQYDNDISWRSPRLSDLQLELHYAVPGIAGGSAARGIYQAALDYSHGPWRGGYAGLVALPDEKTAIYRNAIQYHNVYLNYNYGSGTIYLGYVRTNNVTSSANGNTATTILSNISNPNNSFAGTDPNVKRFYNIYQISVDYVISAAWRVGALYGELRDTSGGSAGARGGSVGAFYSLSARTQIYSVASYLKNDKNAGFRFSGSGAPSGNLAGSDVNGKSQLGLQLGVLTKF
ncbi:porin [Pandoraea communis]|uniref:porin n=1 Tax=Pandoraea communis TaxID=2508297 RepID=UPI0025A5ADD6|nr:porin [Pandoraea communis]MDM8359146.1 porin [Pandoraea communis]